MRDAWSCCSSAEVREGALVSDRRSFSIVGVFSLIKMSKLGDQLLTSQKLSCSAAVSSGSAMGNTMQHDERGLRTYATVAVAGP